MADRDASRAAERPKAPAGAAPPPEAPEPQSGQQGAPGNGSGDPSAPPSVLQELRRKRDEISEDRRLVLEVPGYGGTLLARYKPLPYRELRRAQKRNVKRNNADPEAEVQFGVTALVRACDSMLVRLEEDAEPVELHTTVEEFGDEPVRYDDRLAKALGFEASSAAQVVRLVFKNTYAISTHYGEYDTWLASNETDKDF